MVCGCSAVDLHLPRFQVYTGTLAVPFSRRVCYNNDAAVSPARLARAFLGACASAKRTQCAKVPRCCWMGP